MNRSAVVVLLLFGMVGACKQHEGAKDGSQPDLTDVGDLAGIDQAIPDMADSDAGPVGGDLGPGADLDDHQALKFPPNATPLKQDGGVDYYEMHVKEGMQQVLPGNQTAVWGFEGMWPGPTIRATMGRQVTLKVFNELPENESISIHNHGHNTAPAFDGHPSDNTIAQNASYEYKYPNKQMGGTAPDYVGAGTYFFHDHQQGLTAPHVYKGMAAFYILSPAANSKESKLNLPSGAYDVPLLIQDRRFNADNSLQYAVNVVNGVFGDKMMVNGTYRPYFEVARRKYRFRILNGSNARRMVVSLSSGSMAQIGSDGGLLPMQISVPSIALGPAERADVVIDFAKYKIGDVVVLENDDTTPPLLQEILQFRVARNEIDNSALPSTLDAGFTRYTVDTPTTTRTRDVTFSFEAGEWKMNGKTYNPSAFEFGTDSVTTNNTKLGDVEIWNIINSDVTNAIPHPFHQHMVQFQVLDICPVSTPACGTAPPASQSGWKDTVLVPANSIVRIKMPFYFTGYLGSETAADLFQSSSCTNCGSYVFHCHNLEHEDHLMMLQQRISAP